MPNRRPPPLPQPLTPRLIFFEKKSDPTALIRTPLPHPFINFIYFLLRKFFIFVKLWKLVGTTTNCCWQESRKPYFLNRKYFWYLFKKVKNIWQHLWVFVFVSISKKSKENLFCMWKLCFLIFNNFPFQKFVKHVCRQILQQITRFWS